MTKPSIFLDWFGVIADNELMTRRWRITEAKLLQERYGGTLKNWVSIHDRTFRWYANYWSKHGPRSRANYRDIWRRGEVGWIKRTLELGGVDSMANRELFKLSRALVYEIARRIDSTYPFSSRVLRTLQESGYRLFLVSGADSDYIRGALEATKLGEYFWETYSPDTLNVFKGSPAYWKKILRRSRSDPGLSIVVDDRPKFLRVPSSLGLKTILVDPDSAPDNRLLRVRSIRELVRSDLLPSLKTPVG